jgi:hypothetical protein
MQVAADHQVCRLEVTVDDGLLPAVKISQTSGEIQSNLNLGSKQRITPITPYG